MSKLIPLTQGQFAIVDDKNFEWLNQWKWFAVNFLYTYYAVRSVGKRPNRLIIRMHRQIMNAHKSQQIDHKNSNGLDNKEENIRFCTPSQNNANRRNVKHSSIYKGVFWNKARRKWRCQIMLFRKNYHLGYFDDEFEAANTYDAKAKELFGEFAHANF